MTTIDMLEELISKARKDENLKKRFLDTRSSKTPLSDFCRIARELGYEIYEMDVIEAGEGLYASIKRSTNGGGENSPLLKGQNDYYELFIASIK